MSDIDTRMARLMWHAEKLHELSDRLQAIRAEECSADGAVTVIVDGVGALVDLELTPAVAQLPPREFERSLVTTSERAARRAFAEHAELIDAFNEQAEHVSRSRGASSTTMPERED